jgi:superfamily II DNA helicase RecQ
LERSAHVTDIRQKESASQLIPSVQPRSIIDSDKPRVKRSRQDMRPTRALTMTEELRRLMRQLFGENMTFRSPEQAEALIAVVRKEGPIVVVLPTGGGKSLLFMLPSLLLLAHITIVVTPFVALQHDLVQRCQHQGIFCQVWIQNITANKGLIVVSVEQAVGNDFLGWARNLLQQNNLTELL